jgi:hypothetical protein
VKKTRYLAQLLREVAGLPAGTVGDVVDAIQGTSVLVKFPGKTEAVLVWHEHAEYFLRGSRP